ncbi:MAG: hypothetical protein ABGY75_17825, partial [Gemmataceae bacterium]
MNVRVTNQTQSANAVFFLRQQAGEAARFQDQLSSGLKVKAASDNPAAFASVTQSLAISRRTGTYQQTINDATADLNTGVSSLEDAGQVVAKAKQLAISAANSGNDTSEYEAYASEVDSLLNEMLDIANRQSDGRYLFGGTADGAKPFRVDTLTPGGKPASIAYDGAAERASGVQEVRERLQEARKRLDEVETRERDLARRGAQLEGDAQASDAQAEEL